MHHPDKPSINENNDGIKRASEIINFDYISASEWEQSKIREGRKKVQMMAKEEGIAEGINIGVEKGKQEEKERSNKEKERAIRKAIARGKLTIEEIAEDFGVSVEFVKQHVPF
jgi:DNA invertase Pin-like site-specific DNA recombinase